jgi:hypothetical protein
MYLTHRPIYRLICFRSAKQCHFSGFVGRLKSESVENRVCFQPWLQEGHSKLKLRLDKPIKASLQRHFSGLIPFRFSSSIGMAHVAVKSSHSVHRTSFSPLGQQQRSSECHAQKFCPRIQHATPAGHHNVGNTNRTKSKILRKTYGVWRTRKHGLSRVSRNAASGSFSGGAIPPEGSSADVPAAQVPGSDFEEQLSAKKVSTNLQPVLLHYYKGIA